MNDSVREELKDKISVAPKPLMTQAKPNPPVVAPKPSITVTNVRTEPVATMKTETVLEESPKALPVAPPIVKPAIPPVVKTHTTEIAAKPTSPTLVEFQNKNAMVPEWRLQLQNAVRKRVEGVQTPVATVEAKPKTVARVHLPTSGANALKAEVIQETETVANSNPKLAAALKRIEDSRKRFLPEEPENAPKVPPPPPAQNKNYPFYIATKNAEVMPKPAEMPPAPTPAATVAPTKPKLEDLPVIDKKPYDTNKLKPLPNAAIISTTLERISDDILEIQEEVKDAPLIKISRIKTDEDEEVLELEDGEMTEEPEEGEDLAPFAMRFNAGLFDLIIGAFTSLILLAPFMLSKGNWFSITGLLAFFVTCAIVMFIYLTTAIGMFGKTVGMKIFSLETIDIEENDYPTFHQAAVSSSVYLVSLALGGIGFLPALFNSERRTAPDLLSGTIIVKEY